MSNEIFNVPGMVTQNIARARGFLRRNEVLRALEALLAAAETFDPRKVVGKARYETEVHLLESVEDLSKHPFIAGFLKSVTKSKEPVITYHSGEEAKLAQTLRLIHKALKEQEDELAALEGGAGEARRENLWAKALECLAAGQAPKGKAVLRRLGDEFGDETGVLTKIGETLLNNKLLFEAAEFLESALEKFPKDSQAFSLLIKCYTELREYEKAEELYIKALKQFGQHPNTLLNLGKLYRSWNKRDKALDIAMRLQRLMPDNEEAQDLYDWADGRKKT